MKSNIGVIINLVISIAFLWGFRIQKAEPLLPRISYFGGGIGGILFSIILFFNKREENYYGLLMYFHIRNVDYYGILLLLMFGFILLMGYRICYLNKIAFDNACKGNASAETILKKKKSWKAARQLIYICIGGILLTIFIFYT